MNYSLTKWRTHADYLFCMKSNSHPDQSMKFYKSMKCDTRIHREKKKSFKKSLVDKGDLQMVIFHPQILFSDLSIGEDEKQNTLQSLICWSILWAKLNFVRGTFEIRNFCIKKHKRWNLCIKKHKSVRIQDQEAVW